MSGVGERKETGGVISSLPYPKRRTKPPGILKSLMIVAIFVAFLWFLVQWYSVLSQHLRAEAYIVKMIILVLVVIPTALRATIDALDFLWLGGPHIEVLKSLLGLYRGLFYWMDGLLTVLLLICFSLLAGSFLAAAAVVILAQGVAPEAALNAMTYLTLTLVTTALARWGESMLAILTWIIRPLKSSRAPAERVLNKVNLRSNVYLIMIPIQLISTSVSLLQVEPSAMLGRLANRPILEALITFLVIDTYCEKRAQARKKLANEESSVLHE